MNNRKPGFARSLIFIPRNVVIAAADASAESNSVRLTGTSRGVGIRNRQPGQPAVAKKSADGAGELKPQRPMA